MDAEVFTYALSKLEVQLSQLSKKTSRLQHEIEEGEKTANLSLFTGSIASLPLRVYVEAHLQAEAEALTKKRAALEEAKRELQSLQELKDNHPQLSAMPATKRGRKARA